MNCVKRAGTNLFLVPVSALQTEKAVWKYVGGDTFMHTVPASWQYAELMFSLAEKVDGAVSVKYQLPGEELDPDSLISVSDDSDLQVRCLREGGWVRARAVEQ